MRTTSAVFLVCLMTSLVTAQNPNAGGGPTMGPPPISDAVTLWFGGENFTNLTVYIDSTSNPDDQNKLTTLEIQWGGDGPGFVEANCDFDNIYTGDFDVCTSEKLAKVSSRGFGPVYNLGEVIPKEFMRTWDPAGSWIVDGSYLTGGTLDKFGAGVYYGPAPEPSALSLLALGTLGLIAARRRK